jgi:hypothetical protein
MAQSVVENPFGQKHLDVANALVPRPLKVCQGQPGLMIGFVELFGARSRIPLWPKSRKFACNLFEIDAI